jgi:hypothetical protein
VIIPVDETILLQAATIHSSYKIPVIPACNHAVHTYAGAKDRPIAGKKAIPNNHPIDVNNVL